MALPDRQAISWAFYDWANSAFSTTVMAGFFPIFFKQYWAVDLSTTDSTFRLGMINSLATLLIVVLAPLLGAMADRAGMRKRYLIRFALLGVVMTGALFLAGQGNWLAAIVLYGLAVIGFSGANTFYDSLLLDVAQESQVDRISSLGFSLGYLGGGLLFAVNVWMTQSPDAFGLPDAAAAVRLSFVMVALWWALFSIPLILFVKEQTPTELSSQVGLVEAVRGAVRQLGGTLRRLKASRQAFLFLVAYWLYIDGVDTIVRMAVDYGLALGFESGSLIKALLITQFVGFPSALLFGHYAAKKGAKQGIMIAIFIYLMVLLWAYQMQNEWEFYLLAVAIGLVQGGIQALSRSLYSRLIPRAQAGEFFGFYNMLGKFAAILGPVLMGWVAVFTGSSRISILSIAVLFILGAALLALVDENAGVQHAGQPEA